MLVSDLKKYSLPDTPGVYFFVKKEGEGRGGKGGVGGAALASGPEILYIGKASSLKNRIKSYFDNDILHTRGLHISNMVTLANHLEFTPTRSVLEAILLETELIKKHKPRYNTLSKDDKSFFMLIITEEDFPRVFLARARDIDRANNLLLKSKIVGITPASPILIKKVFGPYPSGKLAKDSLRLIRKIFPFRDKCKLFDKKTPWKKQPCFAYQVGLCPGTCAGICDKKKYERIIQRLITFLEGDGEKLRKDLEKDMHTFSRNLQFEDAQKIKETLFALEHIQDAHLISREIREEDKNIRIEGFDISHISGKYRVGAMAVVLGGVVAKHQYKKFKINNDKNDDLEGLRELFKRRLHHLDWGIPDIVVVDGDNRHIQTVEDILLRENITSIKVVAVTKDSHHKAKRIIGDKNILQKYKREIILANQETHRFALNYHQVLRKKFFRQI